MIVMHLENGMSRAHTNFTIRYCFTKTAKRKSVPILSSPVVPEHEELAIDGVEY
jgi:hypothetical protein